MSANNEHISVGVQQLIEKLRSQGVASGREQAEQLVTQAREQAAQIIADARKQADAINSKAQKEADFTIKAGEESLQLAGRNAILELKSYLMDEFSRKVNEAVAEEMQDQELLRKMILEVAGRNRMQGEDNLEVILPSKIVGVDDLRHNPEELKQGSLAEFAAGKGRELLMDGIHFHISDQHSSGVTFRLNDKSVEVELDEHAVCDLLLKHLQPRFRAMLEGIIK